MKHILLLLLSFFAPVVWGQQVEQFKLWPDKPGSGRGGNLCLSSGEERETGTSGADLSGWRI